MRSESLFYFHTTVFKDGHFQINPLMKPASNKLQTMMPGALGSGLATATAKAASPSACHGYLYWRSLTRLHHVAANSSPKWPFLPLVAAVLVAVLGLFASPWAAASDYTAVCSNASPEPSTLHPTGRGGPDLALLIWSSQRA